MSILSLQNVGKSFTQYKSHTHRIARWFGLPITPLNQAWALKNINLEIQPGEIIGIIGENGAGKSTLLKMIAGITQPTEGKIISAKKISAILELGMGFNPELTGEQNAQHVLKLLGNVPTEIDVLIDRIKEFAEIGEYFDQPIRVYSSGMQMRLAFSVATAIRPEILIIDEALSVGDTYFQHKSFTRIREFCEQGTTLLIVSHSRNEIQSICSRCILIHDHKIAKDGRPEEVFDLYNAILAEKGPDTVIQTQHKSGKTSTASGTGEARVQTIQLFNSKSKPATNISVGERVELKITVKVNNNLENLVLGYSIKDKLGQIMYGTNTWHTQQFIERPTANDIYEFSINFYARLGPGSYSIQTALVDHDTHLSSNYEWRDVAFIFNVINFDKEVFEGCVWTEPKISINKLTKELIT